MRRSSPLGEGAIGGYPVLGLEEIAAWSVMPERSLPDLLFMELQTGHADEVVASARVALQGVHVPVVGLIQDVRTVDASVGLVGEDLTCSLVSGAVETFPQWAVAVADAEQAAGDLAAGVVAQPEASNVLAQTLRVSAKLPPSDALLVESLAYAALQGGREHTGWLETRPTGNADTSSEAVRVQRAGDRLSVVLDRPDRRNALDAAARQALTEALDVARADRSLLVELTGRGPSFCSGGDLQEFGSVASPLEGHRLRLKAGPAFAMAVVGSRTHARVHGAVVGAGLELAAFARRVTAEPSTTFRLPERSMGLIPGAGGTVSVRRRIGRWRTAWLGLTGATLDAQTARTWGLVDDFG